MYVLLIVCLLGLYYILLNNNKAPRHTGGQPCECNPKGENIKRCPPTQCKRPGLLLSAYHNVGGQGVQGDKIYDSNFNEDINFDWAGKPILGTGKTEDVYLQFTGYIKAPYTGDLFFRLQSDDGAELKISNQTVISMFKLQAPTFGASGPIKVDNDQYYNVDLKYFQHTGGAILRLYWKYDTYDWQIVPSRYFYSDPTKSYCDMKDFDIRISAGKPTKSYSDMKGVCESQGKRLCASTEICDMGSRTVIQPELTSEFPGDNWIAVGDEPNEWLTLNRAEGRYCKTHTQVAGVKPGWGGERNPTGFERLAKCCCNEKKDQITAPAPTPTWQQIPGALTHVSAGNEWTWGVGKTGVPGGYDVYKCKTPCKGGWSLVDGGLTQIDVGTTDIWGVNQYGSIYRRSVDGKDNWQQIQGSLKHVSVGPTDWIWGVNSNDDIYRCTVQGNCRGQWQQIPGKLKQIDVGTDSVWGVNSANMIYTRPIDGTGDWTNIPGKLKYVTVGDQYIYGVNPDNIIYRCKKPCNGNSWEVVSGALRQLEANNREIIGTNANNDIFSMNIL